MQFISGILQGRRIIDSLYSFLMPLLAITAALIVAAVMLFFLDASPIDAYEALYDGSLGNTNSIAETLVKATPLIFVGIGICVAFRGGVINIGGEGQMIAGAVAGTAVALGLDGLPSLLLITTSIVVGFIAGALWGGIAGVLKAYFDVNEILSTIMLNQIAIQLMVYLLNGVMQEPSEDGRNRIPKSSRIVEKAQLPRIDEVPFFDTLFGDTTRLHVGFLFALILAFLTFVLLWQTTLGYRIRAVGYNQDAARYAGINVKRQMLISMLLAGGFAGLAGVIQVLGLQYRLQTDGSAVDFTGNAGFNGIVAALFGGLHPAGTIPASVFFGALLVGARNMQRVTEVPASLITAFNGIVVMFVVSVQIFNRRRARRRAAVQKEQSHV